MLYTAISELVALEIVDRLEQITIANGYAFDVASVDRVPRNARDWTPRHLSIVVEQDDEERNEELSHAGNPPAIAYDATYNIHVFVRESDKATAPANQMENAMVAAVKQAVTDDGVDWHTFDDNAIDGQFGSIRPYLSSEGDHAGATVPLVVTYRVSETNPYESRA